MKLSRMNQKASNNRIKPLIDADILRYEVGFGAEFLENGVKFIHNFDSVIELLHHKIDIILEEVWATEPPTLYLTDDRHRVSRANSRGSSEVYIPNFRETMTVTKEYKGHRKQDKPFHYHNLTEYLISNFDCKVAKGIEADDLISVDQNLNNNSDSDYETIICSRDKDLRITPGLHYTWACGKSPAIMPYRVDRLGTLEYKENRKLFGTGLKFFYSQMLMGDQADNIPGIPKLGPAYAFKLLNECESEQELFDRVYAEYEKYCTKAYPDTPDKTLEYYTEQATLLWIIQELDDSGVPVGYKAPLPKQ